MDIRLLGPLRVSGPGGADIEIAGTRLRALLALLAIEAPSTVTTDTIITNLWDPDSPPSKGALHAAISRLRSEVGDDIVETVPGGYRLGIPVSHVDIDRFRRHAARGRQLMTLGHAAPAAEGFRHALSQWEGRPMSDLTELDFVEEAARRLEEERLAVVESLMEAELASGNHQLVVGELSGLVESFPFREKLWSQLMLALYRSGRQAEALRSFARLRTMLVDELGIDPSPELVDLEERILLHDPSLVDRELDRQIDWPDEAEMLTFQPGDVIVAEGDASGTVYWIEDGHAEVMKSTSDGSENVLAELGPGRYFGELASLLGTGRTASVRAVSAVTVSLHSVASFRARLGAERAKDAEDPVPAERVRELIAAGQYLHAYDVAVGTIQHGTTDVEIRWLAVLALSRAGAIEQARRRFTSLGLGSVDEASVGRKLAEDIAGLAATLDKQMALRETGEERERWARRSAGAYQRGFEERGSSYLGVNAATMWLIAGDEPSAEKAAESTLGVLDPEATDYWSAVTEAEAQLVLGRTDESAAALARASSASGATHAMRASTTKQLRMVCELRGVDRSILDPIKNPTVVHFCGHRILPEGEVGRFEAEEEKQVAGALASEFDRLGVGFGFGSLAAGADILAAEALLSRGARLSVVLPFDREEFVRTSVASAGSEWVRRFERCIAQADRVTTASNSEYMDDPVLFDFCARIAMGDAVMRANFLQADVHQVAVWDGVQTGGVAGTAADVATWAASGNPSTVIPVGRGEQNGGGPSRGKRRIRAIVFADFAGFSGLSDAQVLVFQEEVIGAIGHMIEPWRTEILSGRTWGDGLNLVFEDVGTAAECALALQDAVREMDLPSMGLSGIRGMRIAAHATPVFDGWDPIAGNRVFFGAGVTQAARIEPRTPEGDIYTTHSFAALAVLTPSQAFDTQYVGTLPTAKGYGELPLFALRRKV